MNFGRYQYNMSTSTERRISPKGLRSDTTFPSVRTQQNLPKSFEPGNCSGPANAYGSGSPISPASDFMSTTGSPSMEHFIVSTGSPIMTSFEPAPDIQGGSSFMPATSDALFDHDLFPLQPQPETQYGAMKSAWIYDGEQLPWSNEQATAGIAVTLAPELTRLDTQLPMQRRSTFETHYGQPTPPKDIPSANDASETAISPSSLSIDERRMSTARHRKNSTAAQSANEASSTSTRPRRQRKVQARKESAPSVVEVEDDEKREASLARNRIAASKCREKKKRWTVDLEEKERNLRLENKVLQAHKAALTNELLSLKNRALDHKDCKCDPVREYLMISARERIEEMKKQDRTEDVGARTVTEEEARDVPRRWSSARRLSGASDSSGQIGQLLHSRSNSFSLKMPRDGRGGSLR